MKQLDIDVVRKELKEQIAAFIESKMNSEDEKPEVPQKPALKAPNTKK